MQFVWVVIFTCESKIVLSVEPDLELGSPICHANPLADVELLLPDDQGRLDILLRYPNLIHACPDVVHKVILVTVNLNAAASGLSSRLHNPSILGPIESKLKVTHGFSELNQYFINSLFRILRLDLNNKLILLQQFQKPRLA